jgi:hypothetical protein
LSALPIIAGPLALTDAQKLFIFGQFFDLVVTYHACLAPCEPLGESMEHLAELMQRLLEIQSGRKQRGPELMAEDERLMDRLEKRTLAGRPIPLVKLSQAGPEWAASAFAQVQGRSLRDQIKAPLLIGQRLRHQMRKHIVTLAADPATIQSRTDYAFVLHTRHRTSHVKAPEAPGDVLSCLAVGRGGTLSWIRNPAF